MTNTQKRDVGYEGQAIIEYTNQAVSEGSVATLRAGKTIRFGEPTVEVTINWSGCGAKTIAQTKAFISLLQEAVADACSAEAALTAEVK